MASKKVQDFVGRNVGKSVEVTLTTGKTWCGVLEHHAKGYTIKSGRRGRPPFFAMEDVKTCKRWMNPAQPQAERGTPKNPEPEITYPVNTALKAATKQQRKVTPEQLAKAQAIADEAMAAGE